MATSQSDGLVNDFGLAPPRSLIVRLQTESTVSFVRLKGVEVYWRQGVEKSEVGDDYVHDEPSITLEMAGKSGPRVSQSQRMSNKNYVRTDLEVRFRVRFVG